MSPEEYSPSLFDSVRALVVLAYLVVWVIAAVLQILLIRGFRRYGIQEFVMPFYRWGRSDSLRLQAFLYRRDYESRADIPPDLARRCAQMRATNVILIWVMALTASVIILPILWRILRR